MDNFGYIRVGSIEETLEVLRRSEGSVVLAGGTDLLPLMKDEIATPTELVDITTWKEFSRIEGREDGLHIGALARLSDIAADETIRRSYAALADACASAATPQLRNMGTIGGNLLQQTRCWYYRGPFNCWLKGGSTCFARDGENENHSIFLTGESRCVSAHPSDPAAALLAFGAQVVYRTPSGESRKPIEELYALPEESRRSFVTLPRDAVITEVVLPVAASGGRSVYRKAMARAAWSFALAGVALYIEVDGARVSRARVALSGVAPIPIRVEAAERALAGSDLSAVEPSEIARVLVEGARPLSHNGYKLPLLRGLFKEALASIR